MRKYWILLAAIGVFAAAAIALYVGGQNGGKQAETPPVPTDTAVAATERPAAPTDAPDEETIVVELSLPETIDFFARYVRTDGYVDGAHYPKYKWISSVEELRDYYEAMRESYALDTYGVPGETEGIGFLDVLENCDAAFFQEQELILVLLEEPSGSIRHEVVAVQVFPAEEAGASYALQPIIARAVPEVGTCDMAEWHILIQVSKDYGAAHSVLLEPLLR